MRLVLRPSRQPGLRRRGSFLAETMVALFLLVGAIVLVTQLLNRSLSYGRRSEQRLQALMVADRTIAQIRAWGQTPANFRSSWAPWNGQIITDPLQPSYQVQITCDPTGRPLLSPCTGLEGGFGAMAKVLNRSIVPVRVQVAWGSGASDNVVLFSYVGAPRYGLAATPTVSVTQIAGSLPLAESATAQYQAQLADSTGTTLSDVTFQWEVIPLTGEATLLTGTDPRSGRTATVQSSYRLSTGISGFVPGNIGIRSLARYCGQNVSNDGPGGAPGLVVVISP